MNTDELRVAAKKRLKAQQDFKQFLAIWGAVSLLLIVIWLLTGAWGYFWPIWPIFVSAIAVGFVGLEAYGPSKHISEDAVDAEVARLVEQQQQRAAAREAAAQPVHSPSQYPTGQYPYQQGQSGQVPAYDPTQYQGQTAAYDTSQYQAGQTGGYGAQPTQQAYATQHYGAPSTEAQSTDTPAPETSSDWARAAEPTPTEQFAAVFSGTGHAAETTTTPDATAEPAESIVLDSTSAGDTETVTAAADETEAHLAADETAPATAPAAASTPRASTAKTTTTRSTSARKPATKTTTAATAAGTTVRKTSSTRATTGSTTPKASTTKAAATKTTGTAAKPATAKAPAKPRTTKPKAAPAAEQAPVEQPGTPE